MSPSVDYWTKLTQLPSDFSWQLPEQKSGTIQLIGGNSHNFSGVIRTAEILNTYPVKTVRILLPDALRCKLPPLPDLSYAPSTTSGSFAKSPELTAACQDADLILLTGDFSKNSATTIALTAAIKPSLKPIVIAGDAVDLLTPEFNNLAEKPQLTLITSLAQLQKIFRAVYYPRMIMLSQPLLPTLETLHKFTLSYPLTILTFHQNQIIAAKDGTIITTPLSQTDFTPISLWSGPLAARVAALQLWQPHNPLTATSSAALWH